MTHDHPGARSECRPAPLQTGASPASNTSEDLQDFQMILSAQAPGPGHYLLPNTLSVIEDEEHAC